jgi:hypothetical protein
MSGPSDKARFYLEQAVPQLQEFKEKKIFSEVSVFAVCVGMFEFHFNYFARSAWVLPTHRGILLIVLGRNSDPRKETI